MTQVQEAPVGVVKALAALRGGVSLLACVDPDKWNSLGRPDVQDLSALGTVLTSNLEDALAEVIILPDL